MHPHTLLVSRLYANFQALDGDAMAACYHPEATFSDPVFPELHGEEIGNMWRMLTTNARDLRISYHDIRADETTGSVRWEADYTFSKTKRPVHNVIDARFEFRDGLIVRHVDSFDLWKWTRMALGPTGVLLGWSPLVQGKIRNQAAYGLARFTRESAGSKRRVD